MAETVTIDAMIKKIGLIPHPEGGFFLETHRSGSTPMITRGDTDLNVPNHDLVLTGRSDRRPDGDGRRNALTSIVWMATKDSPTLHLVVHLSDHIHYYHSGDSFEYILFDPQAKTIRRVVLGGNVLAGHKFQLPVKGGTWKCGNLVPVKDSTDVSKKESYCLTGEAVAPGFDFHDFTWVTIDMIREMVPKHLHKVLIPYLHDKNDNLTLTEEWTSYYD